MHVELGTRVYYKENGPSDTGTIVDILLDEYPFVVKWDNQKPSEFRTLQFPPVEIAEMLDVQPVEIVVNAADENIDQFKGEQLSLVE